MHAAHLLEDVRFDLMLELSKPTFSHLTTFKWNRQIRSVILLHLSCWQSKRLSPMRLESCSDPSELETEVEHAQSLLPMTTLAGAPTD